jgi:hypothetical protein
MPAPTPRPREATIDGGAMLPLAARWISRHSGTGADAEGGNIRPVAAHCNTYYFYEECILPFLGRLYSIDDMVYSLCSNM